MELPGRCPLSVECPRHSSPLQTAYDGLPAGSRALFLLGALVNQAAEEQVRVLAAVLLRRLFSTDFDKCFPELPPEAQAQLKDQLLLCIQNETSNTLRKRVCECAAELARKLLGECWVSPVASGGG